MNGICVFSEDRKYRYTLWREWNSSNPKYLMVIGLNPSIADEKIDDPTIRRCIDFAKRWGFGSLCMTNIFAWRDTLPENMKKVLEPVGKDNDEWLIKCSKSAGMILGAWGKHGSHLGRASQVLKLIPNIHCLKKNKDGSPQHPLYIVANTVPFLYV